MYMQQKIREIPSLPPAPDQNIEKMRREALASGLADAPESGIEKRRRAAKEAARAAEAPNAESGTEQKAENLQKLEGKLNEYKARLADLDRQFEGVDQATQSKNPDRIDAQCKIAAAEYYLKNGDMDEFAVADILRAQGVPFERADLLNACGVIESYAKTGGRENVGGTGLDGKRGKGSDMTEEEFAADFKEAEADLAKEDALDKAEADAEKAKAEAEAGWNERVAEYEATKNQDILGDTVREAQQEAAKAETVAAKKASKVAKAFADTLTFGKELFINTPAAVYDYIKTGAEDFTHDLSDATLGTTATDKMKGWWTNMFGKQNAEMRQPEEQHRGMRDMLGMEVTTFANIWEGVSNIPGDIARRLDDWSPETMQANAELATEIEEAAWDERNKALRELEAEEKQARSAGLSESELVETLQAIQDKKDFADIDYKDAVQKGNAVKVGLAGAAVKGSAWWVTRGIPQTLKAFIPEAIDYLAMDGLVSEMAEGLGKGLRQERRKAHAEKNPNVPYSKNVTATWGPQEQAMGIMEQLGDTLAGIGEFFRDAKAELAESVGSEAKTAAQKEANIYQDAMSGRIEALTQKTKLTGQDKGEIAYLSAKLARARQGLAGANELATAIKRAEAFAQRAEAKKDDEDLLMGYLAGRAINVIRGLDTMTGPEGKALITALQEDPNPKNLRRAEALVYAHLDRELRGPAESLLTNEQKAKLQEAHDVLKESVGRATETYKSSLADITKDLTKGLQAADRAMKKATVEAEQAHEESERAAA